VRGIRKSIPSCRTSCVVLVLADTLHLPLLGFQPALDIGGWSLLRNNRGMRRRPIAQWDCRLHGVRHSLAWMAKKLWILGTDCTVASSVVYFVVETLALYHIMLSFLPVPNFMSAGLESWCRGHLTHLHRDPSMDCKGGKDKADGPYTSRHSLRRRLEEDITWRRYQSSVPPRSW
jgi:hypothetical protein